MIRWPAVSAAALALVLSAGCNRVADSKVTVERLPTNEASVAFDLEPLQSSDGSRQWIGVYNSPGKVARFRMDFGAPESTAANPSVQSGEGTILPEPGSDSSVLLVDLQKVLRAKTAPKAPPTRTSIPFTYVNLGDKL